MEIVPQIAVSRFEQLEAGDLFIFLDHRHTFYALKTKEPRNGDRSMMVLLGPSFGQDVEESLLVGWQPTTVLSLGKGFSILPSLDPASWWTAGSTRRPVCLAIANDQIYICANGGLSPREYFPCFVEVTTGAIFERRLPTSLAAYTCDWEIAVFGSNHPARSIIKYPLPERANPSGAS
jgi:hypothetical protein